MADHTIVGKLITEPQERDAIHIAVAPVIADCVLAAGMRIGLVNPTTDQETVSPYAKDLIGIVDPFLSENVVKGERFYMFLYPNTITGLKHVWTHPAFKAIAPTIKDAPHRSQSEVWIREFSDGYHVSYEDMMDAAADWVGGGEWFCRGGDFEGESVPDEFWDHYENVTGTTVDENDKRNFFTCSC